MRWFLRGCLVFLVVVGPAAGCGEGTDRPELLLATTTSVQDSGLLDALLPRFRAETGIEVRTIAVGSGAALRLGAEGNADLLLTHAPAGERELVASGAVLDRELLMVNDFVLAGPPEDPAGVASAGSVLEAYRRIVTSGAAYASRGDDSGTHRRERQLLAEAGLDPAGDYPTFLRTGGGMALTLQVAGERRAYTLSDLGSFLAFADRTGLATLSGSEPALRNEYAVLRVDPARGPGPVRAEAARRLQTWLLSEPTQEQIGAIGVERFGRPLFRPLRLPAVASSGSGR